MLQRYPLKKVDMKSKFLLLFSIAIIASFTWPPYLKAKDIRSFKKKKTFYVSGRFLYAPNGEKVVLRGINNMNVVSDQTGERSFPEIAKTGANVVRIMWMRNFP
jgi:hypothetical protein